MAPGTWVGLRDPKEHLTQLAMRDWEDPKGHWTNLASERLIGPHRVSQPLTHVGGDGLE